MKNYLMRIRAQIKGREIFLGQRVYNNEYKNTFKVLAGLVYV